MEHQDFNVVVIHGKKKPIANRQIKPKSNVDLHENDHDNFKNATIPKNICKQIAQARNLKKITQKEIAQKLGIQSNIYVTLENGKAIYDGKTKQLVNKLQNILGTKFNK